MCCGDDADNRAFIGREFAWFLATYDTYPAEIYRADAVRYFYLYLHGGIYADMDTECLRPLDALTQRPGVVLGRMGSDEDFPHAVPNAIMASAPRCEFWLLVMALLLHLARYQGRPEQVTGPGGAAVRAAAVPGEGSAAGAQPAARGHRPPG
jgi:mannosyltransferase OCH1-like enzyme